MEQIEADLWACVLAAGACTAAAKRDAGRRAHWEGLAKAYGRMAATLLTWDVVTWRVLATPR